MTGTGKSVRDYLRMTPHMLGLGLTRLRLRSPRWSHRLPPRRRRPARSTPPSIASTSGWWKGNSAARSMSARIWPASPRPTPARHPGGGRAPGTSRCPAGRSTGGRLAAVSANTELNGCSGSSGRPSLVMGHQTLGRPKGDVLHCGGRPCTRGFSSSSMVQSSPNGPPRSGGAGSAHAGALHLVGVVDPTQLDLGDVWHVRVSPRPGRIPRPYRGGHRGPAYLERMAAREIEYGPPASTRCEGHSAALSVKPGTPRPHVRRRGRGGLARFRSASEEPCGPGRARSRST